jgi:hypothetical protein
MPSRPRRARHPTDATLATTIPTRAISKKDQRLADPPREPAGPPGRRGYWRTQGRSGWIDGTPGPLDPLELALLLEAAKDLSGLDHNETPPTDEAADDGDEDDQEP